MSKLIHLHNSEKYYTISQFTYIGIGKYYACNSLYPNNHTTKLHYIPPKIHPCSQPVLEVYQHGIKYYPSSFQFDIPIVTTKTKKLF